MATMTVERRSFEMRAVGQGDEPRKIVGYAAVFDQIAHGEMIKRGAFTKTLQEQKDIRAYWSHDAMGSKVLGRTTNDTLTLREDDKGLYVEIVPNLDTDWGRSALASIQRGDVDQFSFGFSPVKEDEVEIDGEFIRILREVRLYEVSPVAEPWYEGTSAEAKHKAQPEPVHADHSTDEADARKRELELMEMELSVS